MAKSLLLLFCCACLSRALWAQAPRPDTAIPQKLELKKTGPGLTGRPAYFTKKTPGVGADSVRSLMYMRPARRDSLQLRLPAQKNKKMEVKAGHQEPLFRRQ